MTELECRNVTVMRAGRTTVDGISFTSSGAEMIGIIGPNGAGKSTLMRAIAGLQAHSGRITLDGVSIADLNVGERALRVAFMPQDRTVHWPLCCRDVVMLGRTPHRPSFGRWSGEDRRIVEDAMARMDTAGFAERPFDTLSGGEQARVLIARMLAQEPDILIADEPASGLDPAHQIALMQTFHDIAGHGRTVLVSLHDLTLAGGWCDRVILIDRARLAADGAPRDVLTAGLLENTYGIAARTIDLDGTFAVVATGLAARIASSAPEGGMAHDV